MELKGMENKQERSSFDYESHYKKEYIMSEAEIDAAVKLAEKINRNQKNTDTTQDKEIFTIESIINKNNVSKPKKKKKKWLVLLIISIIMLAGCIGFFVFYFYSHKKTEKNIEEMKKEIDHSYTYSDSDFITGGSEEKISIPVDFEMLQNINEDIFAWIYIPGTEIDYPVLMSENNGYYLSHDANKNVSVDGAIYSENKNDKGFSDFNTVLYGHNMKNGSMFASLHRFEDPEFFESNRYVYIYTADSILVYKAFAAYRYDDRHLLDSFDFSDEKVRQAYIDYIFEMKNLYSTVKNDETVNVDSHILTLSTCCGDDDERWLVQSVLVDVKQVEK